jgi:hypothetical protein
MLYGMENDAYNRGMERDELNYGRQQDLYDKILNQIVTAGYMPSEEELAAAGMSLDEAQKWMALWEGQNGGYVGEPVGPDEPVNGTEWEPEGVHSSGYTNAEIRRAAQALFGVASDDVDEIMKTAASEGITSVSQLIAAYRQLDGFGNEEIVPSYEERIKIDETAEPQAKVNYSTSLTDIRNMTSANAIAVRNVFIANYNNGLISYEQYKDLMKKYNDKYATLNGEG